MSVATAQYKAIAALIAAIVISVLLSAGVQHYISLRAAAGQNETRGQNMAATSDIIDKSDQIDAKREQGDQQVSQARNTYNEAKEEDRRNDPVIRERDDRSVPDIVRQRAHERRLLRERSGRLRERSETQATGQASTER